MSLENIEDSIVALVRRATDKAYQQGTEDGKAEGRDQALAKMHKFGCGDVYVERTKILGGETIELKWRVGNLSTGVAQFIGDRLIESDSGDGPDGQAVVASHMANILLGQLKFEIFKALKGANWPGYIPDEGA
ncbi:MAG: hypothetical protein EOO40_00430 [Deltaproteobacteria bacterium]|nr:MAG: hypothetical protein EOO40_00430 [Deltaproteobacteria bacterium]